VALEKNYDFQGVHPPHSFLGWEKGPKISEYALKST